MKPVYKDRKDLNNGPDMGQLYDAQAGSFADQASNLMTWKFIGSRVIDSLAGGYYGREDVQVLDQGSASGRVTQHLIGKGIPAENITGVEISANQVEIARLIVPKAHFIVGDLRTVELPDKHFDLAVRHMVDEHLDDEGVMATSRNTLKTLKPGGVMVVVFTHPHKMEVSNGITQKGWFETTFPWGEKGQNYYRSKEDYLEIISKAGFIIDKVEDARIPNDARDEDPEKYAKYKSYGPVRLAVKAHKPE